MGFRSFIGPIRFIVIGPVGLVSCKGLVAFLEFYGVERVSQGLCKVHSGAYGSWPFASLSATTMVPDFLPRVLGTPG